MRNPGGDVSPGDPVAFTATGTDADGDTLTYEWDFGDGGTATTKDAMHTYNEVGVFYAKVTVRDGKGGKGSALLKVTVQPRERERGRGRRRWRRARRPVAEHQRLGELRRVRARGHA